MADDRVVDLVAAQSQGLGVDDAAEADDRDVRRAASDVDHHARSGVVDRQVGADSGCHRLLDDIDPPCARPRRGILERTPFDARHLTRHADDHPRTDQPRGPDLVDEVAQHPLSHVGIGDDPVLQRADRVDVSGRAAEHLSGRSTRGNQAAGAGLDGDDGRLIEHDPVAAFVDQGVGGAQVNGEVSPENRPSAHTGDRTCRNGCSSARLNRVADPIPVCRSRGFSAQVGTRSRRLPERGPMAPSDRSARSGTLQLGWPHMEVEPLDQGHRGSKHLHHFALRPGRG